MARKVTLQSIIASNWPSHLKSLIELARSLCHSWATCIQCYKRRKLCGIGRCASSRFWGDNDRYGFCSQTFGQIQFCLRLRPQCRWKRKKARKGKEKTNRPAVDFGSWHNGVIHRDGYELGSPMGWVRLGRICQSSKVGPPTTFIHRLNNFRFSDSSEKSYTLIHF